MRSSERWKHATVKIWLFIKLSRPHFLVGGAVLYALGAVTAGIHSVRAYLLGQALVTAAQLTAHYVNEYADFEADRQVIHRTLFSGGSGVLATGELDRKVASRAAVATSVATVALAATVAAEYPAAAALGVAALIVAWAYSIPPVRLLQTGWGEAATSVVVAVLVPAAGATANGGSLGAPLGWTVGALFFIHMAMMLAFALPDLDSDAGAGKTVLAVRLGRRRARGGMVAALVIAGAIAVLGAALGATSLWPPVLSALPAGALIVSEVRQMHGVSTFAAVATLVTFSVASLITLAS